MTTYKTPAAQTFTEALSNYLSGSEWQQNIEMFVKSNCDAFLGADEFNHEHHALWRTYQDICESILEMALSQAGGSIESLEKALDEVVSIPSKGPREDIAKDILDKLLTFDNFDAFAKMMEDAARDGGYDGSGHGIAYDAGVATRVDDTEHEEPAGISVEIINNLLTLGFEQELIDMVVASSPPDTSLEQLVMALSEMQAGDSSPAASRYKSKKPNLAVSHSSSSEAKPPSLDRTDTPVVLKNESKHLAQFAKEGDLGDVNELHAKFIMARSLLDTFIDGDISPGVVLLVQWASDMTELHAEIEMHHARKQSMTAPSDKRPNEEQGGLVGWFKELEETRNLADDSSLAGNMLSDTEVSRMAELDRIAQSGTDDEQLLHGMISRHDDVVKTINNLHKRCGAMCGPGTGISRQTLEELYLYLKEKVNASPQEAGAGGERDLTQVADELHERVYTMVDSAHGSDIINILLEMHVMEDEQTLLRQKIDSILGSPMHGAQAKDGQTSPRFFGGDDDGDSKGGRAGVDSKADAKQQSAGNAEDAENEARLEALKSKHKDSLRTLRESLEAEKARKLGSLEARLMRRKAIGEKEKAALRSKEGGASPEEEEELLNRLADAEAEISDEIEINSAQFDKIKEGIIGGFKKACIYEMKLTKNKGGDLTDEEINQAHREAADALKKRYLRDRKALAESLEVERVKRRKRILEQLAQRKKRVEEDTDAMKNAEAQAARELAEFEQEFTGQERSALEDPEEGMLLALAGIHSDTSQLTKKGKLEEEDDEDDFFDSGDEEGHNKKAGSGSAAMWLDSILKSRDAFMTANNALNNNLKGPDMDEQAMLEAVQRVRMGADGEILSDLLDRGGDASGSGGESDPVAEHMLKVLTNAFANHVVATRQKGTETKFDYTAARDSILEEFNCSKASFEEALLLAQQRGKDALARRRSRRAEAGAADDGGGDGDTEGSDKSQEALRFTRSSNDYENAVDAFLEDSVMFGGPEERKRNPSFASVTKGFDAYKFRGGKANKIKRGGKGDSKEEAMISPRTATRAARRAAEEKEAAQNVEEAKGIKDRHQTREKELIEALELEMQRKKQGLKMRINKRKQRRHEQEADAFGTEAETDDQEDEAREQEELQNIEIAFDKAVGLLKKTEEKRLHGVNVGQLIDVMNRFANKENAKKAALKRANSNTGISDVAGTGRLAVLPPITAKAEAKDSYGEVEDFMEELSFEPLDDLGTTGNKGGMQKVMEDRRNMAAEVNRISETFNEENQKLDLMMKIQQARQKQSLQRKLLQRRGTAIVGGGAGAGAGAGLGMRAGTGFGSGANASGVPTLQMPARGLGGYGNVSREEALSGIVTSPSPRK